MKKAFNILIFGILLLLIGCGKNKAPNLEGDYHSKVYLNKTLVETIDITLKKIENNPNQYKVQFSAKNSDETDITEVTQEFEILDSLKEEKGNFDISTKELGNGTCLTKYEWSGKMKELKFEKVKITTLQFTPKSENSSQKITIVFQFENENSLDSFGAGYSALEIPLKETK